MSSANTIDGKPVNYYGSPIIDPAAFMDAHVVNPMGRGLPPVCSCGWTPWGSFTMTDHLRDMGRFVYGFPSEGGLSR